MSAPSWQLGEEKPSWYLGDLHQRPRIERVRGPIHRAVLPSPVLIERTASEGAQILDVTFALFDRWTEIDSPSEGRFLERVVRGAFRKSIKENLANIKAILSHGKDASLGSTVLGTIESIREEEDRAVARVRLFPSVPALLLDGLRAVVYGASFRGASIQEKVDYRPKRSAHNPEALPEVTRTEIKLRDVGRQDWRGMTKTRERPTTIRDLLEDDARVICTEGFRPWMGGTIERGRYFSLDTPIVRQHPEYFAVVIPVTDVFAGEIERGGE